MKDTLKGMFFNPPKGGNARGVPTTFQFVNQGSQEAPQVDFAHGSSSAVDQKNRSEQSGGTEMRNLRRHQYVDGAQDADRTMYQEESAQEGDGQPSHSRQAGSMRRVVVTPNPPNFAKAPRSDGRPSGR